MIDEVAKQEVGALVWEFDLTDEDREKIEGVIERAIVRDRLARWMK